MRTLTPEDRARLALLSLEGLSVGDAFGEQFFAPEMFRRTGVVRQLPVPRWKYTDDTIMAISVTEQLLAHGRIDQDDLAQAFVRRFYEEPDRGYGNGAMKLLRRIDDGVPWRTASEELFEGGSLGNGAAMRVAPLGAYFADDLDRLASEARRSAEVTHLHPEGVSGAIAVAAAAAWSVRRSFGDTTSELLPFVLEVTPPGLVRDGIEAAMEIPRDTWHHDVARRLGNGTQITAPDTVPFCLWCAATFASQYEEALWNVVQVGGDIDTNAAIVGGILALSSNPPGIPEEWIRSRESLGNFFRPTRDD